MVLKVLTERFLILRVQQLRRDQRENLREDRFCFWHTDLGEGLPAFRKRRVWSQDDLEAIAVNELETLPCQAEGPLDAVAWLANAPMQREEQELIVNAGKQW